MQRSTGTTLAVVFALSFLPLAVLSWRYWGRLAAGLGVLGYAVVLGVFLLARWEFEVRDEGIYYRVVPFLPVWRRLVAVTAVTGVEPTDENASSLMGRSGVFRGPDGERVVGSDFDGGVRIIRADAPDVFLSSRRPEALAGALGDVVERE